MASEPLEVRAGLPLSIRILAGPLSEQELQEGKGRGIIELAGRTLPFRQMTYEGEQRVKTTWYPGNPTATQQVMGPIELPTTMVGVWKDKYMGDGAARAYVVMFDTIRRMGAPLEVVWGGDLDSSGAIFGPQIVRRGILQKFKSTWDRPQDVNWEATFAWSSQGETVAPVLTATNIVNPREGLTVLSDDMFTAAADAAELSTDPFATLLNFAESARDSLDSLANTALDIIQIIDDANSTISDLRSIPRFAVERGIDVATRSKNALYRTRQTHLEAEAFARLPYDGAKETLSYLDSKLTYLQSLSRSEERAAETVASFTGLLFPNVLAELRPSEGLDLRAVASEWYGNPDLWWVIAQHNGLTDSLVPAAPSGPSDSPFATKMLVVPVLQSGAFNSLRNGG